MILNASVMKKRISANSKSKPKNKEMNKPKVNAKIREDLRVQNDHKLVHLAQPKYDL